MKYFYCYSYKLMRFLKLMDERYAFAGKHPNGNTFWAFPASPELNKKLTQWKEFKHIAEE
jgi:hypothetical protein